MSPCTGRTPLASQVLHVALLAAVHELKDPPVLGSNTLPGRVSWSMKVRQVPEKARPKLTKWAFSVHRSKGKLAYF